MTRLRRASLVTVSLLWVLITIITYFLGGVATLGLSGYVLVVLAASLLIGEGGGRFFFVISAGAALLAYLASLRGLLPGENFPDSPQVTWISQGVVFLLIAVLLHFSFRKLNLALESARQNELRMGRRAAQIQAAAEVSRDAAAAHDVDTLADRAVNLILERFGYYHAGVFLLDERSEYALLKAATGEAGQKMIAAGYRLKAGQEGIVGHVAASGQPRIAHEVGKDEIHLANPLLPETRSELALPLKTSQKIIGVLDVQSRQPPAFDEDDVAILQTMADQLAIAFESARLLDETRRQIAELTVLHAVASAAAESASEHSLIESATQVIGKTLYPDNFGLILLDERSGLLHAHSSYREHSGATMVPIPVGAGIAGQVAQDGKPRLIADVLQEPAYASHNPAIRSRLVVPLKSGNRVIGVINAESTRPDAFTEADQRLLVTLAGQLATAIQKIRLIEETQHQVIELGLLLNSSAAVSTSLNLDTVLDASVRQITAALDVDGCCILTWEREKECLVYLRDFSPDHRWQPAQPGSLLPLAEFPHFRRVLEEGSVLESTPDYMQDHPRQAEWLQARTAHSLLLAPLIARSRVIGILVLVNSSQVRQYAAREIALFQTMANQLATGLEHARLYEAELRRLEELEALRRASLRLTSSLEWQPALDAVLLQALNLVAADAAYIYLYDGKKLSFGSARLSDGTHQKPHLHPRLLEMMLAVAQTGEVLVLPDIRAHPRLQEYPANGALLGFPLRIGRRILGVMNLAFLETHHADENELRVLSLLADQAAIALENARLYSAAQRRARELASALDKLRELDTLKNEFVQNVSHELRTPLTIIRGYAELLQNQDLGEIQPEQAEPLAIIVRRARMMSKLVEDLTTILESEANAVKREPVDLGQLLTTYLADFQNHLDQAGLRLETSIEPGLPVVLGDPDHLLRVVDNLLGNALKFTPRDGAIQVSLYRQEHLLMLEVSDTGVGIPPDQQERIFERFYQVDGSTTRRYSGTGLGLALVKEVVETHGGSVAVQSQVGRGTTFTVKLPAASPQAVTSLSA